MGNSAKTILGLVITILYSYAYSQDTIITVKGDKIISKVIEIGEQDIKYKKTDNLDGPNYTIAKREINKIVYQNGSEDFFNEVYEPSITSDKSDLFAVLTKKGNRVYVESDNSNGIVHAKEELNSWGYWKVVNNISEADFIIRFNLRFGGLADYYCIVNFIDPNSKKILKTTNEVSSFSAWDVNSKRAAVKRAFSTEIKPLFY